MLLQARYLTLDIAKLPVRLCFDPGRSTLSGRLAGLAVIECPAPSGHDDERQGSFPMIQLSDKFTFLWCQKSGQAAADRGAAVRQLGGDRRGKRQRGLQVVAVPPPCPAGATCRTMTLVRAGTLNGVIVRGEPRGLTLSQASPRQHHCHQQSCPGSIRRSDSQDHSAVRKRILEQTSGKAPGELRRTRWTAAMPRMAARRWYCRSRSWLTTARTLSASAERADSIQAAHASLYLQGHPCWWTLEFDVLVDCTRCSIGERSHTRSSIQGPAYEKAAGGNGILMQHSS